LEFVVLCLLASIFFLVAAHNPSWDLRWGGRGTSTKYSELVPLSVAGRYAFCGICAYFSTFFFVMGGHHVGLWFIGCIGLMAYAWYVYQRDAKKFYKTTEGARSSTDETGRE
jgi:hypothetical protein